MTHPQVDRAADAFSAALVEWRATRGLSKKQLAAEMGFDPSYVSHVEGRRHKPGAMITPRPRESGDLRFPGPAGLIVEYEHAELSYDEGSYRCTVRRELFNAGSEPVTRYLVRIAVDRYPGEP